jgi:protein-disulfide isomerase
MLLIGSTVAIVAVMAIIAGVWFLTRPAPFSDTPIAPGIVTPSNIPSNSTTLGQANAPATIDLYGDFRCSACFNFTAGQEPQLVQNYVSTGKAKLVWHDFLTIDTPGVTESRDAANAALCAADQGKFWMFHDWLYANQSADESPGAFTQDRLLTIGKNAGLDTAKYNPCVQQGSHLSAIQAEQTNHPAGITGTPAVFVNGKQIQGPVDPNTGQPTVPDYPTIAAAIDAALNPSASPAASGSVSPSASASPSTAPSTAPTPSASPSASPS